MKPHPKSPQAYKLLHDGVLALSRAEQAGIRLDVEYTKAKQDFLTKKIARAEDKFKDTKFFRHWANVKPKPNIYSDDQLRHFLYYVKKIEPPATTKSGMGSTDEKTLKQLNIPELDLLIEIRKLRHTRDTYLGGFLREQVNGFIYPSFNLHLPTTFRSSSNNPNFQNIPKRNKEMMRTTRKALFPRVGHQLFSIDFSGLEVRIAACYHKDPTMLKYINNPTSDMHGDMAEQIFKMKYKKGQSDHDTLRAAAKNGFVFPQFYGDWYKSNAVELASTWGELPQRKWNPGQGIEFEGAHLSDHLIKNNLSSFNKFTKHIKDIEEDFWSNRFPDYAAWKDRWWEVYKRHGHIEMLTGFRCSGVMTRKDVINYPVQGAAFHCLLWSLIQIDRIQQQEGWDSRIIGQIHDELVIDLNPDELNHVATVCARVTCEDLPNHWDWIIVPLDVEMELAPVDTSWADVKEFKLN
jgi:DNA polymerase-1